MPGTFGEHRAPRDGLTKGERTVLDLWDDGLSIERIADRLCVKRSKVANITGTLLESDEARRDRVMIAQGSAQLLAALQRNHPQLARATG